MNKPFTKVCLIIPSLQAGGMERVMAELANYFANQNSVITHLILYGINREIFYDIKANIKVHKPTFEFNNRIRIISTLKTIIYLRCQLKIINPTTILSFGEYWNNFVLLATFNLKFPIYLSDRCQPNKSLGAMHNWLRRHLYPRATGIIAQTSKAKEIFHADYQHSNIVVIGNPIRNIPVAPNEQERENIILTVGRLIHSKNHDQLIRLFTGLDAPGWKLVIVGYDHLKQKNSEKLKTLIRELKMEDRIVLAGKQHNIDSYYNKSKIFAFTSSSEGFPNVIGEAMSAGLPVVAFDCIAGPSEMIKDGENGFLVPLYDYDQFQLRLQSLIQDTNLRIYMGENAKRDIQAYYSPVICEKYGDFIFSHVQTEFSEEHVS